MQDVNYQLFRATSQKEKNTPHVMKVFKSNLDHIQYNKYVFLVFIGATQEFTSRSLFSVHSKYPNYPLIRWILETYDVLGKGGVTHNMIGDIHNHWKMAEAVRIKCLGVPTLDMDIICYQLEV